MTSNIPLLDIRALLLIVIAISNWVALDYSAHAQPFQYHTATLLRNGDVLVIGDSGTMLYSSISKKWIRKIMPVGPGMINHRANLMKDGAVIITGGQIIGHSCSTSNQIWRIDPSTFEWVHLNNMNNPRMGHSVNELYNGALLIVGGHKRSCSQSFLDSEEDVVSAEVCDRTTLTCVEVASPQFSRSFHSTLPLGKHETLFIGGGSIVGHGSSAPFQIYDDSKDKWERLNPPVPLSDSFSTPMLEENGKVLILARSVLAQTNIDVRLAGENSILLEYDIGSRKWNLRPLSFLEISQPYVVALPDAQVLVTGGFANHGDRISSHMLRRAKTSIFSDNWYLIDPRTGRLVATGKLPHSHGRAIHSAVRMNDGRVLLTGGIRAPSTPWFEFLSVPNQAQILHDNRR